MQATTTTNVANYEALQSTMEVASHETDDRSRRAGGVVAVMVQHIFGKSFLSSCLAYVKLNTLSYPARCYINTIVNDCFCSVEVCIRARQKQSFSDS
jgi:hypothetical protein